MNRFCGGRGTGLWDRVVGNCLGGLIRVGNRYIRRSDSGGHGGGRGGRGLRFFCDGEGVLRRGGRRLCGG